MKTLGLAGALLTMSATVLVMPQAGAQDAAKPYDPANTTVALLPVVNISGEKVAEQKQKQAENGKAELVKEFTERGFKIVDEAAVTKAIQDLKIDLNDEEQQKRDTIYRVGKAVNADLAVFVVITDVSQTLHQNFLSASREGRAKVKVWLLDVKQEKAILSGVPKDGKSGGGFFAGLDKGSARIVIAVANGIRDVLKDFFKPYSPEKKK